MLLAIFVAMPAMAHSLTWGVCAHPLGKKEPWNDPETEIATLARYGLTTYRFDIPLTDDRSDAVAEVEKLVQLADKYHITLHPILYVPFTYGDNVTDSGKYPATDEGLEQQGYQRVYPFVLKFASKISDWELENELNLLPDIKTGNGLSVKDYNTPKGRQWAAVLRGMARAVHDAGKAAGASVGTVVDTTYVYFSFIEYLEQQGVSIDKLAYHYYYPGDVNPHQISSPDGVTVDLFLAMKRFGKPVIINEFNAAEIYSPHNEGKPYNDAKALAGLKKHIGYILAQREANLEGVEYYELYNEPAKDIVESNFGLMKDAHQARIQMLLAAFYAGGKLSPEEKRILLSSGLLTQAELNGKAK